MVAFTYRMPAGIPGDVTRFAGLTVEPQAMTPLGTTGHPTEYGIPVVIDASTFQVRSMTAGDTTVYGFLVRPFPTGGSQDGLGTSTPPDSGACDVMRRGYMTVKLRSTTAAVKGGVVYIWTAAASGDHVTGGVEAASPGGSGITVTGAYFMGPADANGLVEIAFNI